MAIAELGVDWMSPDGDDYSLPEVVRTVQHIRNDIQNQMIGFGARFDNYLLTAVYKADVEKNAVVTETLRLQLASAESKLERRVEGVEQKWSKASYLMLTTIVAIVVDVITRVWPTVGG